MIKLVFRFFDLFQLSYYYTIISAVNIFCINENKNEPPSAFDIARNGQKSNCICSIYFKTNRLDINESEIMFTLSFILKFLSFAEHFSSLQRQLSAHAYRENSEKTIQDAACFRKHRYTQRNGNWNKVITELASWALTLTATWDSNFNRCTGSTQ